MAEVLSAEAAGPGLRVHYIGRMRHRPPPRIEHPHWRAPWFAIQQCGPQGGEFANDAGVRIRLGPGAVWNLVPGVGQSYGPVPGAWWGERIVAFDGWLPRRMLDEGTISALRPVVTPDDPTAATGIFDAIIAARDRPLEVVHLTYALITLCCRTRPRREAHPVIELAERLRCNPERPWDIHHEATKLGMRYNHLRQEFRRRLGVPPQRWLITQRVDRMAALLANGRSVAQAARTSGFGDASHAARLFARLRGQPPGSFARAVHAGCSPHTITAYGQQNPGE